MPTFFLFNAAADCWRLVGLCLSVCLACPKHMSRAWSTKGLRNVQQKGALIEAAHEVISVGECAKELPRAQPNLFGCFSAFPCFFVFFVFSASLLFGFFASLLLFFSALPCLFASQALKSFKKHCINKLVESTVK